jgi:exosome complex RNA-binding protein Rrp4
MEHTTCCFVKISVRGLVFVTTDAERAQRINLESILILEIYEKTKELEKRKKRERERTPEHLRSDRETGIYQNAQKL